MEAKTSKNVVVKIITIVFVFALGLIVGAGILYFTYARPLANEDNWRVTLSGEGYHLLITGNDMFIHDHPVFWRARTHKKVVALTFDDGPSPDYTEQILEILKKENIVATFFVVGQEAEKYPNIVKDEMAAGNEIENHSYTHPNMTLDSTKQLRREVNKTSNVIEQITGRQPRFLRPPKGLLDENIIYQADGFGVRIVLWSASLERSSPISPQDNVRRLVKQVRPGTIILAHDGMINRIKTVESLPFLIDELKAEGYRFVTVEELYKTR